MERLILTHLRSVVSPTLDPLQFAYRPNIGVEDAVIYFLQRTLSHLEPAGGAFDRWGRDFLSEIRKLSCYLPVTNPASVCFGAETQVKPSSPCAGTSPAAARTQTVHSVPVCGLSPGGGPDPCSSTGPSHTCVSRR
uniref:Reverse transcriptase domain-containing protein n=1 Tax=Knipowitschia caucasica TaxID=637954 RepID=A0AAV2ME88_KNICA